MLSPSASDVQGASSLALVVQVCLLGEKGEQSGFLGDERPSSAGLNDPQVRSHRVFLKHRYVTVCVRREGADVLRGQ